MPGDRQASAFRRPSFTGGPSRSHATMCRVTATPTLLASIPSPHDGTIDLGPLTIHLYGLTLLVAIAICMWVAGRRWVALGGDWDL